MRILQVVNAGLAVFGSVMGIVLAVVCLIYVVHLDAAPRMRAELPVLVAFTAGFLGLAASGALAFLAQRRRWTGRWWLQAVAPLPLAAVFMLVAGLRS